MLFFKKKRASEQFYFSGAFGIRSNMRLDFIKMHGLGNDYIYFDCFNKDADYITAIIDNTPFLSDRHFGVGGDGTVLILPSNVADAKMRMFNIDGSEGKMCGNAIRCVGKYLFDNGICKNSTIKIETLSGIKTLSIESENGKAELITVDMGSPILECEKIPCVCSKNRAIEFSEMVNGINYTFTAVSMGNPHAVMFYGEIKNKNIEFEALPLQKSQIFPESVNVEFIKVLSDKEIDMRVYERGSGETMACGTGACASVVAGVVTGKLKMNEYIKVNLLGGTLYVNFDGNTVFMKGSATKVFEGSVNI